MSNQSYRSSCVFVLVGFLLGMIVGFWVVVSIMQAASVSGNPVGYEGFSYLFFGSLVGGVGGGCLGSLIKIKVPNR